MATPQKSLSRTRIEHRRTQRPLTFSVKLPKRGLGVRPKKGFKKNKKTKKKQKNIIIIPVLHLLLVGYSPVVVVVVVVGGGPRPFYS